MNLRVGRPRKIFWLPLSTQTVTRITKLPMPGKWSMWNCFTPFLQLWTVGVYFSKHLITISINRTEWVNWKKLLMVRKWCNYAKNRSYSRSNNTLKWNWIPHFSVHALDQKNKNVLRWNHYSDFFVFKWY